MRVLVLLVVLLTACGLRTRDLIRPDDSRSQAFGYVTLGKSGEGHTPIEVSVYGLSFGGAQSYVVWLVPHASGEPKKLGTLELTTENDVIALHGFLRAEAPQRASELDVVVTAERDAGVTAPSGDRVLWASLGFL